MRAARRVALAFGILVLVVVVIGVGPTDPTYRPTGLIDTFEVTNGPSYREVFDLGDLDGGRIVQTTGNSGNPYDRHYGDLTLDWLAGRLIGLPFSHDAVSAVSVATLTLVP